MKPAGGSKPASRQASPVRATPVEKAAAVDAIVENADDEDRGTFA